MFVMDVEVNGVQYELRVDARKLNSKGAWETCELINELCNGRTEDEDDVANFIDAMLYEPIKTTLERASEKSEY